MQVTAIKVRLYAARRALRCALLYRTKNSQECLERDGMGIQHCLFDFSKQVPLCSAAYRLPFFVMF